MIALTVALALTAATPPKTLLRIGGPGLETIRPQAISAHVKFLAHDLLEGRGTGSRGERIATEYIAAQFAAAGLEPAGDDGTFFQWVPLRELTRDDAASAFEVRPASGAPLTFELGKDFDLTLGERGAAMDVAAPVVFAGYAVRAPELGHDDLATIDVKGKIALFLYGAPERFPSTARAWYSRSKEKVEALRALGAAGAVMLWTPQLEAVYPWEHAVRDGASPRMILDEQGLEDSARGYDVRATLSSAAAERTLQALGYAAGMESAVTAAKAGRPSEVKLSGQVRFAGRGSARAVKAPNVVARWPGSDPKLSREHVVFSSHHDHLGIAAPVNGDAIYNGAVDNASGVAALIEIARAFAALPRRPARSILFVTVTAEEEGTVGSDYFARRPSIDGATLVANVNVDMVVAERPLREVVALGDQHSTLGAHVGAAARALKLTLGKDAHPDQVLFIRSDQISFVQQGVPALFLVAGEADGPGEDRVRAAVFAGFLKDRYHQPGDEWRAEISWEAISQVAEVAFLTGLSVAQTPQRPAWNRGDFFERARQAPR